MRAEAQPVPYDEHLASAASVQDLRSPVGTRMCATKPADEDRRIDGAPSHVFTLACDSRDTGRVSILLTVCGRGRDSRAATSQRRKAKSKEPRRRRKLAPAPDRRHLTGQGEVTSVLASDSEVVGPQVIP